MRRLGTVCRVESLAFHLQVRLNIDFGGLHIDVSKEIFDHDEGNAGLEKVQGLCMSHGMGTDSQACQRGHGGRGPAQVLQQNVSCAVPAQSAAPPVLQEWLLVVELTSLGRQELLDQPC